MTIRLAKLKRIHAAKAMQSPLLKAMLRKEETRLYPTYEEQECQEAEEGCKRVVEGGAENVTRNGVIEE